MELILASNSPRRKELLKKAGFSFTVIPGSFEEKFFSDDPTLTARSFAEGKAKDVYGSLKEKEGKVVLGADTVVFHKGKILGKPADESEARNMLRSLSGDVHQVVTGYSAVCGGCETTGHVVTEVYFNKLSDDVIDDYIISGLYRGKAGSYGIQDGFPLVKKYRGSLTNVIGLPIEEVTQLLNNLLKK